MHTETWNYGNKFQSNSISWYTVNVFQVCDDAQLGFTTKTKTTWTQHTFSKNGHYEMLWKMSHFLVWLIRWVLQDVSLPQVKSHGCLQCNMLATLIKEWNIRSCLIIPKMTAFTRCKDIKNSFSWWLILVKCLPVKMDILVKKKKNKEEKKKKKALMSQHCHARPCFVSHHPAQHLTLCSTCGAAVTSYLFWGWAWTLG